MRKLLFNSLVVFLFVLLGAEMMPSYGGGWIFSWAAGCLIGAIDYLENRERRKIDENP